MVATTTWALGPMLLMLIFGGMGVPLGMPPGPEDPMMANVAPEECLLYLSWAGVAKPDPKSANQTEQLLAEPEVQRMFAALAQQLDAAVANVGERSRPESDRLAFLGQGLRWGRTLLSRPGVVFVSQLQLHPGGGPPDIRGGAVFALGDEAARLKTVLEAYQQMLPPAMVKPVEIEGATWHRIQPNPKTSALTWGVQGSNLIVGLGEDAIEGILERAKTPPPAWLADVRTRLAVDRVSTVSCLNVRAMVRDVAPLGGPRVIDALDALGLTGVTSVASVTGLDAQGFVSRTLVGVEGKPAGLVRLASAEPLAVEDLAVIPADATVAVAGKLDAKMLLETLADITGRLEPRAQQALSQSLAALRAQFGIDLEADVLGPLGDTWRVYSSPSQGGLVFTGMTAVVSVDDREKLAAANERLVAALRAMFASAEGRRGVPQIDQFEFAGRTVYVFNARTPQFPLAPAWCLTEKELVVAAFPQNVKAFLSREASAGSLASVPEVAAAMTSADPPIVLCYNDTPKIFELVYPLAPFFAQAISAEMQRGGINISVDLLPSAPAVAKHLRPGVTTVCRTAAGVECTTRQTLPGGNVGATAPVTVALLMPAVQSSRGTAKRVQSMNNMKQIALAMLIHENVHGRFPPAYSANKEGKPLLSWRVLILPFIEEADLYEQFHLDEPWDSPHNKTLLLRMPALYRSPTSGAAPGYTNYLTPRGENTAFPGAKPIGMRDITDGTSHTIMLVEASDARAVPWTKPDDFAYDQGNPMAGLVGLQPGGFLAAMCDGSVQLLPAGIGPEMLKAYFTRNGGESVPPRADFGPSPGPIGRTVRPSPVAPATPPFQQ